MSKEEAIEILSEMRSEYNLFGDEEEATRYHVLSWAIKEMNAEPVRHGRWIEDIMPITGAVQMKCSNCGQAIYVAFNRKFNYCPHCGVKMDESKGETKEREDDYEEPEINPCRGCEDYDGKGGCLSHGGCAERREDAEID